MSIMLGTRLDEMPNAKYTRIMTVRPDMINIRPHSLPNSFAPFVI